MIRGRMRCEFTYERKLFHDVRGHQMILRYQNLEFFLSLSCKRTIGLEIYWESIRTEKNKHRNQYLGLVGIENDWITKITLTIGN